MMKKYLLLVLLVFLFASCKKSKKEDISACGVTNPIQNLTWLNQKVKLFTGGPELNGVVLYKYNDNEIIQINQTVSSKVYDIYNCDGKQMMFNDADGLDDYIANRKKVAVLYGTWEY